MNNIHQKIISFLEKYDINKPKLVYIVAFSGGYDSMCLLNVLRKAVSNKIVAVHLNHNWRGLESDIEENNCRKFCQRYNIKFYSEKLNEDTPHTETAARNARYEFFEKCSKRFKSSIIFTAHNKNDNAETVIYRMCKGTGISGLQGIAEHRGIYYRPLLKTGREEIETYCRENNLTPNNDSSNNDTKYKRNFIRSEIIPVLKNINPDIFDSIETLSEVASEEYEIVNMHLGLILSKISEDGKINTQKFLNQPDSVQKRIVYNFFIDNNLDYDRTKVLNILDFIRKNSESKAGKTASLTRGLWIFTSEKHIEIFKDKPPVSIEVKITEEGVYESSGYIFQIEKYTKPVLKFPQDCENYAYVNLENFPLNFVLRGRNDGDIIQPLGVSGTQKLKKYLNSKKIPNHEKDNLLFLTSGKEILWAVGLGISDKIKVVNNPTHILLCCKIQKDAGTGKRRGRNGN